MKLMPASYEKKINFSFKSVIVLTTKEAKNILSK